MKIVLCKFFVEKEFKPLQRHFSKNDILKAGKKIQAGLGTPLQSPLAKTKLVKVYLTGKSGAGRALFLAQLEDKYYAPLILRLKSDKKIGENMSMVNTTFNKLLDKYLDCMIDDIEKNKFESIDL